MPSKGRRDGAFPPGPLRRAALAAACGSAALLAAALAFQHLGGYAPCPLCILQRWPHVVAVLAGVAILVAPRREIALVGALAMLAGAAIAAYHAGVEQGWWQGPTTCGAPSVEGVTPEELLEQILQAPVVRCDEIAWSFLGLSMAAWNGIASALLAAVWARAYASSTASQ